MEQEPVGRIDAKTSNGLLESWLIKERSRDLASHL